MEKKRVVFTGGGTGGHVYPNIAIYEEMREKYPGSSFLYIGTQSGAESRIVKHIPHPIEFAAIQSRGIPQSIKSFKTLVALFYIFIGTVQSFFLLRRFKPDIVIGSGGYVAAPVLIAASLLKIKVFIHEQNAVPGRLNRFIARFAARIGVSFASTAKFFPEDKVVFTGYPLRKAIRFSKEEDIKKKYKIPEENKVVFIFGGSGGAKTINTAIAELIPTLLGMEKLTVILSTGRGYSQDYKAFDDTVKIIEAIGIPPEIEGKLIIKEYFDNIDQIYSITDLVISRAGAGTIKEITTVGIPSILIPKIDLPGDHQILNAREVEKAGGARIVYEEVTYRNKQRTIVVPETSLLEALKETLFDNDVLFEMRKNLRKIEKQNSLELLLAEIEQIFKGQESPDEQQVKIFYLHSPENEKNIELVFHSTTVGNSALCDVYLDDIEGDVLLDLTMFEAGERTVIKKLKGNAAINGNIIDRWAEIKEDDRLEIGPKTFILKSYSEKVKQVHIEKTAPSKILGSSAGVMLSRFGGLFRQIVIAAYFGTTRATDIFIIAWSLVNFWRRVVAEDVLEKVFLPIFSRLFRRSSRKKTWEAASSVTNFNLLFAFVLAAAGFIFAPLIIKAIFYPLAGKVGMIEDTIAVTRWMTPYLFLAAGIAIITTYLKHFNWHGIARTSSLFFAVGMIGGIVLFQATAGLYAFAYGIYFGVVLQVLFLYPFITRTLRNRAIEFFYKPVIHFSSPVNKKYYAGFGPAAIEALLVKVNEIVALFLASGLKTGAIAFLSFALTIFRYPFDIISRAINNNILKEFTDEVALFDKKKSHRLFIDGIKINIFLLTPLTILVIILAEPIVSLIFERGLFKVEDTTAAALALQFYVAGLAGWGIYTFTSRFFSAGIDGRTSVLLNTFMLVTNVTLSFILVQTPLSYAGIALAAAISHILFAVIRIIVLKKKLEKEEDITVKFRDISLSFSKTLFSALLMVIPLVQAKFLFTGIDFGSRTVEHIVLLIALSFIGISVYLLSSLMLKNTEILFFKNRFLRKEQKIPLSMLSPFRFFEKVSRDSDTYRKDYFYKINIYISSNRWETRNVGIKLIGLFEDKSKAGYLVDILTAGTENGFVRRNALTSLRQLGEWNQRIKRLTIDLLEDPYYEVRAAALELLTRNSTVKDYRDYCDIIRKKLKTGSLDEKLACIRLMAKIGEKADMDYLEDFFLNSNSLIREGILELIHSFYKRKLLTADEIRKYTGKILFTSNNMQPEFELKVIIKKIYKEIEKG